MKPTLEQVVDVLRRSLNTNGWIGEGDEIVRDLLDYIEGIDDSMAIWAAKWEPLPLDRYWWRNPPPGVDGANHDTTNPQEKAETE